MHYVRNEMSVPEAYNFRAIEEFDLLRVDAARRDGGSFSNARTDALVKWYRREALSEYECTTSPLLEEFIPNEVLQPVVATVCKWSAAEEEDLVAQRC